MIGIYRIYRKSDGRSYIGKSINIEQRISGHFSDKRQNCPLIARAISKHGIDSFDVEILEICSEENLNHRESHWIATMDSIAPNGYNLRSGGEGGNFHLTTKQKMRKAALNRFSNKEDHPSFGKPRSQSTREKIRKTLTGRYSGTKNPFYGKNHSESTKRKIGSQSKGRNVGMKSSQFRKDLRQQAKKIYNLYQAGKSYRFLGRHFNTSGATIKKVINEYQHGK